MHKSRKTILNTPVDVNLNSSRLQVQQSVKAIIYSYEIHVHDLLALVMI